MELLVEEQWRAFEAEKVPPTVGEAARGRLQAAFYAGAFGALRLLGAGLLSVEDDDAAVNVLDALLGECRLFHDEVARAIRERTERG